MHLETPPMEGRAATGGYIHVDLETRETCIYFRTYKPR